MKKIIWKDKYLLGLIKMLFVILFAGLAIYAVLTQGLNNLIAFILAFCLITFSLYFAHSQIRKRRIYVTLEGIRIGNIVPLSEDKIFLKQKPSFFNWKEIKKMDLKLIDTSHGIYKSKKYYYLILITKKNQKYECILYDVNGFKRTLKKLDKISLLA